MAAGSMRMAILKPSRPLTDGTGADNILTAGVNRELEVCRQRY